MPPSPPSQHQAVQQIAAELGMSRSELVSEAIGLFVKVILEAKRGHRLVTLDPLSQRPAVEITTPTLAALEWALHQQQVQLPPDALETIEGMLDTPAAPTAALHDVMKPSR